MNEPTLADMGYRINMVCCTFVICNEIEMGLSRKSVALSYALAMKSEAEGADKPDWRKINEAAIARWGVKGLSALKDRAYGIAVGRVDPYR